MIQIQNRFFRTFAFSLLNFELFGVYLLILKRAVLRYIRRLWAAYRLPACPQGASKHATIIITQFQAIINRKRPKNCFFLPR